VSELSLVPIKSEDERVAVVDRARAMLAQARTPVDAKRVADLAKSAETYARLQQLGEEAVSHARAICVDALALMGAMLKEVQKNQGALPGKTGSKGEPVLDPTPTLADQGITKKQSMQAQALAVVKETKPELYEQVKAGKASIETARTEVKRQEKREEMAAKVEAAKAEASRPDAPERWRIVTGEVGTGDACPLLDVECDSVRLIFADPPYNIGFDYGEGHDDAQPREQYLAWCSVWINQCADLLTPDGAFWMLINDEHAAEFKLLGERAGLTLRNWVIWYETFGVNCSDKFNRTKRHLLYFVRDPERLVFHFDAVSRPSDRQAKYQDPRASAAGKVLDDVWLDIPRLVGTAAERIPDFPTQLPVALLRRIVGCCSDPGDLVLDPFNGSGTTGAAALELNRRYIGVERSTHFGEIARNRLRRIEREAA
jgi:DNA modification methylase